VIYGPDGDERRSERRDHRDRGDDRDRRDRDSDRRDDDRDRDGRARFPWPF
jgi:hypothetical protein